ncbi:hypothetical protein C7S14_4439 [Burkholderia cepacia]|nr:hypothetical protein C7S14_4439 [Burkholderia cepacia]
MERQLVSRHGRVPGCAGVNDLVNENDYYIQNRVDDRRVMRATTTRQEGWHRRDAVARRVVNTFITPRPNRFIK